jgi:hypothetical protein
LAQRRARWKSHSDLEPRDHVIGNASVICHNW